MIPQFSICIPAYRNPAALEACLRTVLDQPGDDYEIVASDDQGPPGIRALVERLAQPDRIRYLRSPRRLGLSSHSMASPWASVMSTRPPCSSIRCFAEEA